MRETVITIITALFNIAVIVLNAVKLTTVANILSQIAPEVNILALAILWFFGYRERSKKLNWLCSTNK